MPLILCVEDDIPIRRLIVDLLEADGHETIEAGDGQDGMEAVFEHKPDLVLLDVMMPVMDGFEVLTVLREKHPKFADMPIIFLTALASREHVIAGKELGADDYITKPIDTEMLIATVNSRLIQIARIKARKQMQLFRLYGALM
ncbi:MAG: response regulator, partial [Rhodospirillales bacterium]|nr:response regulator [Rhodospirillales bacterium]